jgi:tetratricopeptide (TPR) repeat protein
VPPRTERSTLRILLACARPLTLRVEQWEAELSEPGRLHLQSVETALGETVDLHRIWADGRSVWFETYPPSPPSQFIRDRLASFLPLTSLRTTPKDERLDVTRLDEELEALTRALEDIPGGELFVHPAATLDDVRAFLQANDIDVLQFVGHGDERGGLYFEDGRGGARRVTPHDLVGLLAGRVKLLCAGSCYSAHALPPIAAPGAGINGELAAAIAMDGEHPIPSRAVQVFAKSFYFSLIRGRDVGTSFSAGQEAVRADDIVGERPLPDGADRGMPSPWKRLCRYGDPSLSWHPDSDRKTTVKSLVKATPHRKLPRTDDLFVGRNIEIAATVAALEPPRSGIVEHKPRVVTLYGEGGIGKTRLAGAVAEWLAQRAKFSGSIVEVDCERADNAIDLAVAILAALGVERPESIPNPPDAVVELLGSASTPRLFVLDNLDNLFARDGVDLTVLSDPPATLHPGMLLKRCLTSSPTLRILATCRWPLHLGGDENAFEVDPLGPEEAEELFILSVHHQDLRQALLADSQERRTPKLAPILRATERMPLALVLAARRLTDPGQDLATTIRRASEDLLALCEDDQLAYLPPRLRSVRASLQLSYDRLSEPARELFGRISFFPDGVLRSDEPLGQILGDSWQQLLQNEIVDFALARYDRDQDRFTLLQPILAFAREKLNAREGDAFRRETVQFWMAVASASVPFLKPSQLSREIIAELNIPDNPDVRKEILDTRRQSAFDRLLLHEGNMLSAVMWALAAEESSGDRLIRVLDPYLDLRALWRTQEQLYVLATERAERAGDETGALRWRGNQAIILSNLHRWDEAKATYTRLLATFRPLADADPSSYLPDVATTLNNLGILLKNLGERDAARAHFDEALDLRRQLAARYPDAFLPDVATTLNNLGNLLTDLGERDTARAHYEEALNLSRQLATRYPDAYLPDVAMTLNNLGNLLANLGERDTARAYYEEALDLSRQLATRYPDAYLPDVAMTLNNLGALLADLGERDTARAHYEEALNLSRQLATRYPDAYRPNVATTLNNLGNLLANLGERDTARAHYEEALNLSRQLATRYPDAYRPDVAMTLNNLGNLLANLGERDTARAHYEEALPIYWAAFQKFPRAYLRNVLIVLKGLRLVYGELGLTQEEEKCAELMERLVGSTHEGEDDEDRGPGGSGIENQG